MARKTLKFHGWPGKTIGHLLGPALWIISKPLVNKHWSYSTETPHSGQNRRFFFIACDLENWRMTLKHLGTFHCYFTLCASFHSHQWIKAGVTVWKCPIRVKISDFCPMWPWKLMDDLEKQQGISSMQRQALIMHHFVATDEFELELLSGNVQFGGKICWFFAYYL